MRSPNEKLFLEDVSPEYSVNTKEGDLTGMLSE